MDADKVALCWPNRIDEGTLAGSGYSASLPLVNLQDRVFAKKARTTSAADNFFTLALPKYRTLGCAGLAAHNFTTSATWRVRVYADTAMTQLLYDSGIINVWPTVYVLDQLEWEFDNFWTGTPDEEAREAFTPLAVIFFDQQYIAQAVRVDFSDSSNSDGFFEFGRFFTSQVFQPELNMSYGANTGFNIGTVVDEAQDGTEYFDRRDPKRTAFIPLEDMEVEDAYSYVQDLQRACGVDGEILFAYDLNNTPQFYARTFIARQVEVDPISQPYFERFETSITLQEIL